MKVQSLHHVAYRCNDAKETADFYTKVLDMPYVAAVSETNVPSTGESSPYMHIFFGMGDGSCVAFFEVPEAAPMQKDPNTPEWVQPIMLLSNRSISSIPTVTGWNWRTIRPNRE